MEAESTSIAEFFAANNIEQRDAPYRYDAEADKKVCNEKPWIQDVNYFNHVRISALALVKMVTHAQSGGNIEVMGMLQGRVEEHTFVVLDVFALPVEGTETRVNAQTEAYEYMSKYVDLYATMGFQEKVLGWYHSHPGYGCWLSGIDVGTQELNQRFTEPFLGIVVDPVRTLSSGKVDLGAFRTYPLGREPKALERVSGKYVPMNKAEDFGHYCHRYYPLEVSYFMSYADERLFKYFWNAYWVQSLTQDKVGNVAGYLNSQLNSLDDMVKQVNKERGKVERIASALSNKCVEDSKKLVSETSNTLIHEFVKREFVRGPPKLPGAGEQV